MTRLYRVAAAPAIAIALVLGAAPARLPADTASHYEAAAAFYDEVRIRDPGRLSEMVTDLVARLEPGLARHREVVAAYARDLLASPAYREARIGVYMELFDEEELRTLTWLFRHEAFRRYRERRLELVRRNTELTLDLFRAGLPDLQRRIREASGEEGGAPGAGER